MGAYRSKPITEKISSDEQGKYVKCGASSMQGWRVTQEDAHNCILDYDEETSLFAVYDGHGGHEVAHYCSKNLPQYLKECASYKNGEYEKSLEEAFLGFDATLVEPDVLKILQQIVKSADEEIDESEHSSTGSEDEENISNLYMEAQMPLEKVLAKYQTDGKTPVIRKLKEGAPPSPYLTAKKSSKKDTDEAGSSKAGTSSSSSSNSSSSSTSSSTSTVSASAEGGDDSSSESADKEDKTNGESEKSHEKVSNGNAVEGATSKDDKKDESVNDNCKSAGDSDKREESSGKVEEKASSDVGKEGDDVKIKNEVVSNEKKDENEVKKIENEVVSNEKIEKREASSEKDASPKKIIDGTKVKDEVVDNEESSKKKPELNGEIDVKNVKTDTETEKPHENGDVADEETETDDEKEVKEEIKSSKGKGKVLAKLHSQPKRTSARQRSMAALMHTLLTQYRSESDSDEDDDDEGDEEFQGDDDSGSGSNEEDDKEDAEGEGGEEEEGEEEAEDEEDDVEEEESLEEDFDSKLSKGPGVESGCTAVVALLRGRDLYVANAGDSRCIVCRSGEALDMSLDHKPEDDVEIERIVAAGGFVSPDGRVNGGLNLSRAIGDHAYKQMKNFPPEEQMITALPDVRTLSIDPEKDEFMVLACDGIWNSMTSQEVVTFVRTRLEKGEKRLSEICEELFDFCLAPNTASDGTGCDNMTAVIVQFLPIIGEAKSSDLPNTSISTATNKRPASPSESADSSAKRFKPEEGEEAGGEKV